MGLINSTNAEKGKEYYIKNTKGKYIRLSGLHRRKFTVLKTFEQTETGTIVKDTETGVKLDLPAGTIFEEV